MPDHDVLYFGCWFDVGHYLWTPKRTTPKDARWANLYGVHCGDPALTQHDRGPPRWFGWESQPQGRARIVHLDGWTIMAFWDRSDDARLSSNSAFLARGEHDFEAMCRIAAEHFPAVWRRITSAFDVVLAYQEAAAQEAPVETQEGVNG